MHLNFTVRVTICSCFTKTASFLTASYRVLPQEADENEPIYSQPIKPKTKKISRSECEDVLVYVMLLLPSKSS